MKYIFVIYIFNAIDVNSILIQGINYSLGLDRAHVYSHVFVISHVCIKKRVLYIRKSLPRNPKYSSNYPRN